jgi:hydroxymethylglutaryl-CoA lyase
MTHDWPTVHLRDETMREGMQIESADIEVAEKIELIRRLATTGVRTIVIGSFVSPRYTPQMAHIDEIAASITPVDGVEFQALVLNDKGAERRARYQPVLSDRWTNRPALVTDLCDTFGRRNVNVSRAERVAGWPAQVEAAVAAGVTEVQLCIGSAWGSNFQGRFTHDDRMSMAELQHDLWTAAGVRVAEINFADPMSWCLPHVIEEQLAIVRERWPDITDFTLHLHNARGLALTSVYAAMRALDSRHHLYIDATAGGIGGCPYCGNGRATGMAPMEDLVTMLEQMGIDTGVDILRYVEVVKYLEGVLGRATDGHVSRAGPPPDHDHLYDPNLPFVETFEQAGHFLYGPGVAADGVYPWKEPIPAPDPHTPIALPRPGR